MSLITAATNDATGRPDNTEWAFAAADLRGGDGDGEIITPRPRTVRPVAGLLSVELEDGPVVVHHRGRKYTVLVDGDADLWNLLSAAVGVPVTTPADLLAAAVETFVENNPGYPWSGISGKPDVDAKDAATLTTATGRAIAFAIALG